MGDYWGYLGGANDVITKGLMTGRFYCRRQGDMTRKQRLKRPQAKECEPLLEAEKDQLLKKYGEEYVERGGEKASSLWIQHV